MTSRTLRWIAEQRTLIERAVIEGVCAFAAKPLELASAYDWRQSLHDQLQLSSGGDCCYDRPSIGAHYALWYHLRRTEAVTRALAPIADQVEGDLHLVDLGCGTGAGLWGIALVEAAHRHHGGVDRRVIVTASDTSPFMLRAARRLWEGFRRVMGGELPTIDVEWRTESWASMETSPRGSVVVLGSYLFDWSDIDRADEIAVTAGRVFDALHAEWLVLSSVGDKKKVLGAIAGHLATAPRWVSDHRATRPPIWRGESRAVGDMRRQLLGDVVPQGLLNRNPPFREPYGLQVVLRASGPPEHLPLSTASEGVRYVLDDAQDTAARHTDRPTAVLGAAGSGKSRVLVERVVRTLEHHDRLRRPCRVLVSTFNKLLVDQLAEWIIVRSRDGQLPVAQLRGTAEAGARCIEFDGGALEVRLLNWDKVPTRLFEVARGGGSFSPGWVDRVLGEDDELRAFADRRPDLVTPRFLEDELRKVVYGLEVPTLDAYLDVVRTGRETALHRVHRPWIWRLLHARGAPRTFTHVRMDAHRLARANSAVDRFDLVAIDEYQDFLPADFTIARSLVVDGGAIVVAGDPAQALHLGKTAGLPGTFAGRRWMRHELRGSYRLPVRICEAIEPLARTIKEQRGRRSPRASTAMASNLSDDEIQLPSSVKTAVLGVRPIIVAGTKGEVARDIEAILRHYRPSLEGAPGERVISLAEGDSWIESALRKADIGDFGVRVETMRAIKGLERPCVMWSTRATLPVDESIDEWVYTILTRTTCLLVVALAERTPAPIARALAMLRRDRLLFWSAAAEQRFDGL